MKSIFLFSVVLTAVIYFSSCEYNPVEPYDPTPKVSIVNPVNNSSISDSVTVKILINNIDVKRVELFIDHYLVSEAVFQKPPYEYFWDCRWYQEGSQHILQAKAYNQSGKAIESDFVIINIYRFMPNALSASITSDSTIFLHWYDNCKFETGFELESATEDSNFIKIADLDSNSTTYTLNGQFEPENKYLFRVSAVANNQFSGYSEIATAEIRLIEPTNLGTSLIPDTSITFFWTDNNSFEKGYVISKDFGYGFFVPIKILPENSTNAVISDIIIANQYYRYTVHAIRDYYESPKALFPFEPLQFPAPSELTVESATQSSLKIKWKDNSSFEKGFIVMRGNLNGNWIEVGRVNANIISFVDNNLDTSQTYSYHVQAFTDYNQSYISNIINVYYSPNISLNKQIQVPNGITDAVVSNDFSLVALGGYLTISGCVRIYDLNTGTILKTLPGRSNIDQFYNKMAISPDNKYIAAIGDSYTITIWDINTGQVYKLLSVGGTPPNFVQFTKDSKSLIVERDRYIRVYNMMDWSYKTLVVSVYEPYALAVDINENYAVLGNNSANITVYNYQTGALKYEIPNTTLSGQLSFDPTGKRLSFYADNKFMIWDIESNSLVKSISNFGYPIYMGVSPDEKLALFTGNNYNALELWNISQGKRISRFYDLSSFAQIKFSPDNQRVFTRELYNSYYLWDVLDSWVQEIN